MDRMLDTLEMQGLLMLEVIPNLIKALAILLIGYIIAKVLAKIVRKLLVSIGADSLAERLNDIDLISKSNLRIVPSVLFSKLLYYLLMLVVLMASADALGIESVSELMNSIVNYLPKALSAFLVLLLGIFIADFVKKIVLATCQSLGIPAAKLIANAVFYFLFLNVIMITLKQAELQTAFMENNISIILAGIIFAFSIGYGLASRPLMANLLSAFYNKDRIRIGDVLTVENVKGEVIAIDSTTLTLQTDSTKVIIPLSKLSQEKFAIHDRQPPPNRLPSETR